MKLSVSNPMFYEYCPPYVTKDSILVDKAYQGKGMGSWILLECERFLREKGFERIQLAYAKDNSQSESFWEKNGFHKQAGIGNFYKELKNPLHQPFVL